MLQEDIGKILNLSGRAIGNYENGKRDMSPNTIIKLANFFDVSTDFLLGKTNIRNFKTEASQMLSNLDIDISKYVPEFSHIRNFNLSDIEIDFLLKEFLYYLVNNTNIDKNISSKINKSNLNMSNIEIPLSIIQKTFEILNEKIYLFHKRKIK